MVDVAASGSDEEEAEPMADVATSRSDLVFAHEGEAEVVSSPEAIFPEGGTMATEVAVGSGNEVTETQLGISYPLAHYLSYDLFSCGHRGFLATITVGVEPKSYHQASKDSGWCAAMLSEIRALEDNGTRSLVDLAPSKKALGSR
ncbi:hypothetical protein LIER_29753 [Lithospermum erythrorhizon]|uniref:Uncharacterized protein n=1 Tax=Lithospermum erythrorhizon TaxID=34254 RepID=A0AAV3RLE7_LITER